MDELRIELERLLAAWNREAKFLAEASSGGDRDIARNLIHDRITIEKMIKLERRWRFALRGRSACMMLVSGCRSRCAAGSSARSGSVAGTSP